MQAITERAWREVCPSCGERLGVMMDGKWVPMTLDEYRQLWVGARLNSAAARANRCRICGPLHAVLMKEVAESIAPRKR